MVLPFALLSFLLKCVPLKLMSLTQVKRLSAESLVSWCSTEHIHTHIVLSNCAFCVWEQSNHSFSQVRLGKSRLYHSVLCRTVEKKTLVLGHLCLVWSSACLTYHLSLSLCWHDKHSVPTVTYLPLFTSAPSCLPVWFVHGLLKTKMLFFTLNWLMCIHNDCLISLAKYALYFHVIRS